MSEFTDTVAPAASAPVAFRPPVQEDLIEGSVEATRSTSQASADLISDSHDGVLPPRVQARIDALIERERAAASAAAPAAPVIETPVAGAATAAPAEAVVPAAAAPAIAPVVPGVDDELARLRAMNAKLVADLEAKPTAQPAAPGFVGKIDYLDDSLGHLRESIGHQLGVAPDSKEVDAELAYVHADLTAKLFGVTSDQALLATRDAARAKQLFAREKRQRTSEGVTDAGTAAAQAATKQASAAAEFIGPRLPRTEFPLLTELAQDLDGVAPEALLWTVIQRETKTGRLDPRMSDDALIREAAKIVEDRYQVIVAKATKAAPPKNPSTVTPAPSGKTPPAASTTESKATPQSHGGRTITNADASVAPATPPAKTPNPTPGQKPKFKNDKERQQWALRHLEPKS